MRWQSCIGRRRFGGPEVRQEVATAQVDSSRIPDFRIIVGMLLLLLACTGAEPDDSAPVTCDTTLPQVERLDVPTGYRVMDIPVDAPSLAEPRTVPMALWYPTDATEGEAATFIGMFKDENSLVDAPFADPAPGCKLPLIVYSHGSQAWGGSNSPLLRHLAAQGWVAAAPDHVDNTLTDNVDPRPVSYSLTRVADIRSTLDAIEALPEGDPLHDRVDTSKVLVMGHSFGGQTSWLLSGPTLDTATLTARCDDGPPGCTEAEIAAFDDEQDDPRIVATLPLDGFAGSDIVAPSGWSTADRPILYLSKSQDGDSEPITVAASTNLIWARFDGACHETFNNSPLLCDGWDKAQGLDQVAAFMTSFATEQILGTVEEPYVGILNGTTSLDPRISVQRTATASP